MLDRSGLSAVFRALADPTRRDIIERLVTGATPVSRLAETHAMSLQAVMQHLRILESAGLADSQKIGRVRTFRVNPQALRDLEDWVIRQRTEWEQQLDRLEAHLTAEEPKTDEESTMPTHGIVHDSFTLERRFTASPERVFAMWSDPAAKGGWFAGDEAEHRLDFRVGGTERSRGRRPDGTALTFDTVYREIIDNTRIVYTSGLYNGDTLATQSLTSVEFEATDSGTRLVITEQGCYLDGWEKPDWRRQGTESQLDALASALERPGA